MTKYIIKITKTTRNSKVIYEVTKHIETDGASSYLCANFFEWMSYYLPSVNFDKEYFSEYPRRFMDFDLYFTHKKEAINFVKSLAEQNENIIIKYIYYKSYVEYSEVIE